MPEYTIQQLEEFRLRRELAQLDAYICRYENNLQKEITASESKLSWKKELSRKAGKASGKARKGRNEKFFQDKP